MNAPLRMIGATLLIGQADGKSGLLSMSNRTTRVTFLQDGAPTMAMVGPRVIVRCVDGREPQGEVQAYGGNTGIISLKHRVSVATNGHRLQGPQRHGTTETPSTVLGQSPDHVEIATGWMVSGGDTPHRRRCHRNLARG